MKPPKPNSGDPVIDGNSSMQEWLSKNFDLRQKPACDTWGLV